LAKGLGVLVDGRLNQRRWEDKETGQKRSKVEIIAEVVRFMGKKSDTVAPEYTDADIAPHEVTDDDVPF
jgi:single-strand DNA-binding protein